MENISKQFQTEGWKSNLIGQLIILNEFVSKD